VGRVRIAVYSQGSRGPATGLVEVVPTKLEQGTEYRRMLTDITTHAAEAVLQGFAPSALEAALSRSTSDLLYQRFAVLDARLRSEDFTAAVGRIVSDPHVEWRTMTEDRPPGGAYPTGSAFGRALAASGARRPWLTDRGRPALASMPTKLERNRHETTVDTAPNRFVKHALESWRALAQQLRSGLSGTETNPQSGPVRRGAQAAETVIEILDDVLGHPVFRDVGSLERFPASNQVLLKREGYRQLLEVYALVDAGLDLPWDSEVDDVYSPNLRNVAALYEMWSYLTLVEIVGQLCEQQQGAKAFAVSRSGLSLLLKAGSDSALEWRIVRHGRPLLVRLMYNRQFAAGGGSWTAPMRPDCSICIRPLEATPRDAPDSLDVWVHFDAKYRVTGAQPIDLAAEDDEDSPFRGTSKRADLLKMHAYRDAIHRTAGAYVLYPGDASIDQRQFVETLPGLGAFPLRPGSDSAHGAEEITCFLSAVLDHVAEQASQHERDRFWRSRIYRSPAREHAALPPVPFLDRPPADTDVLVGYVRGPAHRTWIEQHSSYNVRAGDRSGAVRLAGRELGASLLLLYERAGSSYHVLHLAKTGGWRAVDRSELISTGYPSPGGDLYLVTPLHRILEPPTWLGDIAIDRLRPSGLIAGAPFAVTWLDLMASVQSR
jgi:uncharacterized protein